MHGSIAWLIWLAFASAWTILLVLIWRELKKLNAGSPNETVPLDLRSIEVWPDSSTSTSKERIMADPIVRPDLSILDSQGTTLAVNTKNAGGEQLPESAFAWSVEPSDGSVGSLATERPGKDADGNPITITAAPGSRFFVNTHPGEAIVKVVATAAGETREESMKVIVGLSGPGELGLSAGEPFADQ